MKIKIISKTIFQPLLPLNLVVWEFTCKIVSYCDINCRHSDMKLTKIGREVRLYDDSLKLT
jgi:hypothetical protein